MREPLMNMKVGYKAALTLAFLVLVYTLYTILLKVGGSTIGLIPQLFYAFLVGFVVSSIVSFAADRGRGLASIATRPKMLFLIVVMGLINNALAQLFLGTGTLGTNPSIAGIVYRSWVIMVALLIPLTLRQKIKKMQLFATGIGFLGLYLVISGGTLISFNYAQAPYMVFLLLTALCSVVVTLAMSKYTFNIFGATVLFNLASFVLLASLAAATHTSLAASVPLSALLAILFLGVFGFGIATPLYYQTVKALGPQLVGNAILTVPFLTIILSAPLANTPIEGYYFLSAFLISAGVILQRHYSGAPERITTKGNLDRITLFDITGAFANSKSPIIMDQIAGSKRALAMKLENRSFDGELHNQLFAKKKCIAFTSKEPFNEVSNGEMVFINDIMGLGQGETALVGLGDPQKLEEAFEEFVRMQPKTEY